MVFSEADGRFSKKKSVTKYKKVSQKCKNEIAETLVVDTFVTVVTLFYSMYKVL